MAESKPSEGINLGLIFWNTVPATWFLLDSVMIIRPWIREGVLPDFSKVLLLCQMMALGLLFLFRNAPQQVSWKPWDFFIAIFGTFAPLLLALEPSASKGILVANFLGTGGLMVALAGVLSLNRSFGIVPANRGIKTDGMYRFVRHPIYFSYQIIHIGYFINHPTPTVAVVIVLAFIAQVLRIQREEALLSQDPEYAAYMKKVRFRLLPPLF